MTDINRLTAVLAGSNRGNNLCHNGAGNLKALRAFNHFAVHNRAVIQHIADINQAAVENRLNKIVGIMKMQHAFFMRLEIFAGSMIRFVKSLETSPAIRSR